MRPILLFICLFIVFFTGCSPSPSDIQTAIAQTKIPTTAPTKVSIADINLDTVPFQAGDLPNQYKSGQIHYEWTLEFPQPIKASNVIIQKVGWDLSEDFKDDYVMIALFKSNGDAQETFRLLTPVDIKTANPGTAGEQSNYLLVNKFSGDGFYSFVRCNAFVLIRMTGADMSERLMSSYGKRIDKRLRPLICS